MKQVRYGKNKVHDHLPQINLTLLFGEQSRLPFYYRKLEGNIPDVKTLKKLVFDLKILETKKARIVLGRGFYSVTNINNLYKEHIKFLVGGKMSLKLIKTHLNTVRDKIQNWSNYNQDYQLYTYSLPIPWDYVQERPYKKDVLKSKQRMYLHFYYNSERVLEDEKAYIYSFLKKLYGRGGFFLIHNSFSCGSYFSLLKCFPQIVTAF